MRLSKAFCLLTSVFAIGASSSWPRGGLNLPRQNQQLLQDNVTWDEYSLMIHGKRLPILSGEVHPYRLPVPTLYLDVFQKIKAAGLNTVSFYVFWGILEPKRGEISYEGFRDLQPFIDGAKEAGIYLVARPGPYINAETTAGGFPGWGTYTPGLWRTSNTTYVEAYQLYMRTVLEKFVPNEITQDGPIILVQAENEYGTFQAPYTEDFEYEARILKDIRDAGITLPIFTNDASPGGHYRSVDIYGYDSYPNGFDCSQPYNWNANAVPESFWAAHMRYAPEDPNAVFEYQGGAFDGWGGAGFDMCAVRIGPEFERVFYKNEFAMSTTMFSIYMIYGGTNWGGISHPNGYTSYDYGAAITEDRKLREKYYELKLQFNFWAASPAYLTSRPQNVGSAAQGAFTGNSALKTTQVLDVVGNQTAFYVVRQTDASSFNAQTYSLTVNTSAGLLTIPTLGGNLTLPGRDSKIHVVDYAAGSTTLTYSTGEIMTWATIDGKDIIVIYGNEGELHETAFNVTGANATVVSGDAVQKQGTLDNGALVLQYVPSGQTVVTIGEKTLVYLLDRQTAYYFWVLHIPTEGDFGVYSTENPVIIKGGYLLRSVSTSGGNLAIKGDLNATADFEIIAPAEVSNSVTFNGEELQVEKTSYGTLIATKEASLPDVELPDLSSLPWKTADSLPEIQPGYSDAFWTIADHTETVNPWIQYNGSAVLIAGDYGYHTGNILWRAHFTSTGSETSFTLNMQGGLAFGFSIWLNSTFLGSWEGNAPSAAREGTFSFPEAPEAGSEYVLTILQDHMGYDENWYAASDSFKQPRCIYNYTLDGGNVSEWRLTGNLGGEDYADRTRGALNEGGLYGERQGWHLPGFDDSSWESGSPLEGIAEPGVSFYRSTFSLDMPDGVDYPLALVVTNSTENPHYRAQFYVNGYQFGKYINAIGPQKVFPVPQGVLNYKGDNTLAVSLWAHDTGGAKLASFDLQLTGKMESSMPAVDNIPAPAWEERPGAY